MQGLDTERANPEPMAIDGEAALGGIPWRDDNSGFYEEASFESSQERLPPTPSTVTDHFPGAARSFDGGRTFLDKFDTDEFNSHRASNMYYPFAYRGDWEMASWLLRSKLSMNAIDSLLSLDLVRTSQESRVSTTHRAIR